MAIYVNPVTFPADSPFHSGFCRFAARFPVIHHRRDMSLFHQYLQGFFNLYILELIRYLKMALNKSIYIFNKKI